MELRTQVKKINLTSKENSLVLEISDDLLGEKLPELKKFIGEVINIQIIPEVYSYQVELDEDGHPISSWKMLQDGSVEIERNEQLNLLGSAKTRKEMRKVLRSAVDEFIQESPVIEHINDINPKDVLDRLKQGEDFSSIASDYGLSDSELVTQLDEVRQYYLPVADAWINNGRKFEFADKDKNSDNPQKDGDEAPF